MTRNALHLVRTRPPILDGTAQIRRAHIAEALSSRRIAPERR